ncbi:enolase-phosphatase E1-like [Brevipalpus obovatus]|uniref:enolase-phosphatase E1-like n=1 Tax=Brevipalpus obovatus TaxID=246614 RepID=UPI003D9EEA6C
MATLTKKESSSPKSNSDSVAKPEAIVFDLQGILRCDDLDTEVFIPYIRSNTKDYLKQYWSDPEIIQIVQNLRTQSIDIHYRRDRDDCPVVEDEEDDETNADNFESCLCSLLQFLEWQMTNKQETVDARKLHKKMILEGLDTREITIPVYEDVQPALNKWTKKFKIKVFVLGSLEEIFMDKVLARTKAGNLHNWLSGFLDSSFGQLTDSKTFSNVIAALNTKPTKILFITNSGKVAKAAEKCGLSVMLIERPRVRIREYYTTKFPTVTSLSTIAFIDTKKMSKD